VLCFHLHPLDLDLVLYLQALRAELVLLLLLGHVELVFESRSLQDHVVVTLLRRPVRLLHSQVPPCSLPEVGLGLRFGDAVADSKHLLGRDAKPFYAVCPATVGVAQNFDEEITALLVNANEHPFTPIVARVCHAVQRHVLPVCVSHFDKRVRLVGWENCQRLVVVWLDRLDWHPRRLPHPRALLLSLSVLLFSLLLLLLLMMLLFIPC